jgi:signal peptidase I
MQSSGNKADYELPEMATSVYDPYLYHGESMRGTFRFGDRLTVEAVSLADLRPGDVLVYRAVAGNKKADHNVVHRVIAITPTGAIMRGDSNPGADITLVAEHNILGRVTQVECNGRLRPVPGGLRGLLRGRFLHAKYGMGRFSVRLAWFILAPILRKPYRRLRSSGAAKRIWHPTVTRVHLQTDEGSLVKYVVDSRTVASWWPQTNRFQCRKPYDLIILPPEKNDT